jgi:hypothetical protein
MRLYDPTSTGATRTLHRAPALASLDGKTIGILENGKLNAIEMLREIAVQFERQHGCRIQAVYKKTNASAPAPSHTLEQAAKEVDFLITGLGD